MNGGEGLSEPRPAQARFESEAANMVYDEKRNPITPRFAEVVWSWVAAAAIVGALLLVLGAVK